MSLSPRLLTFVMAAWKAFMTGRDSVEKAVRSAVRIPCSSSIVPSRVIRRPCWSVDGCELPDRGVWCVGLPCFNSLLTWNLAISASVAAFVFLDSSVILNSYSIVKV